MANHIFLTGEKQIGKSTILRKVLTMAPCHCAGFLTVKSTSVYPGTSSVHMLDASFLCDPAVSFDFGGTKKEASEENFLFFCGRSPETLYHQFQLSEDPGPRFDCLGSSLLGAISANTDCIIMDEIGPHEDHAVRFQNLIFHYLDGSIPVFGVLQQVDTPLYHRISRHPAVTVITVAKSNRDDLPDYFMEEFLPFRRHYTR